MIRYAIYDKTTGEIIKTYSGPNPVLQLGLNQDYVQYTDDFQDLNSHYIDIGTKQVIEKLMFTWTTRSITANGIDVAETIDYLPSGIETTIITPDGVDNIHTIVDDGVIQLSTIVVGDHTITLRKYPFKDQTTIITVVPIGSVGLDCIAWSKIIETLNIDANLSQNLLSYKYNTTSWLNIELANSNYQQVLNPYNYISDITNIELNQNMEQLLFSYRYIQTKNTMVIDTNYSQLLTNEIFHFNRIDMNLGVNIHQVLTPVSYITRTNDLLINTNLNQVLEPIMMTQSILDINITPNFSQLLFPGYYITLESSIE